MANHRATIGPDLIERRPSSDNGDHAATAVKFAG